MSPSSIIARKRDGYALSRDEIIAFVRGATDGSWADYQLAAMLMAIFLRGMNAEETAWYTDAMMRSGTVADLSGIPGLKVDKHSTGGVGDKISLPLAPLVAACGVPVPMISGRGLGFSGGTLDKLEAIPGFRTSLSLDEFRTQVARVGCALIGQTRDLAPADRKLYALRDVTATVECVPLICGSILSKKLAEGIDALVLDVKFGRGAFMKTRAIARELAAGMVAVGQRMGVATTAYLTDMNQPLGRMAGNAVEVAESLDCLRGGGPSDLRELVLEFGEDVLVSANVADTRTDARARLLRELDSGRALERFERMVAAQGGRLDAPRPIAPAQDVCGERSGVVESINTEELGWIIIDLGGGRRQLTDSIDHSVGLEMLVHIGDDVASGQPLVRVFAPPAKFDEVASRLRAAITIGDEPTDSPLLIAEHLG